jgi:hypothetical protein
VLPSTVLRVARTAHGPRPLAEMIGQARVDTA